jgi:hypothetical protein
MMQLRQLLLLNHYHPQSLVLLLMLPQLMPLWLCSAAAVAAWSYQLAAAAAAQGSLACLVTVLHPLHLQAQLRGTPQPAARNTTWRQPWNIIIKALHRSPHDN